MPEDLKSGPGPAGCRTKGPPLQLGCGAQALRGAVAGGTWLAAATLASAQARTTYRDVEFVRPTAERLTQPNLLWHPTALGAFGDWVVVLDFSGDSMIVVIDRHHGRLVGRFGRRGDGPGEFRAPVASDVDRQRAGALWIVDGSLRRATRVLVTVGHDGSGVVTLDTIVTIPVAGTGPITSAFVGPEGELVFTGFFTGPRFGRFQAGQTGFFGPPAPGDETIPVPVRHHAYQTTLARDPLGTRFAAATRYSDRLELFQADGSRVAAAARERGFDPRYSVRFGPDGPAMSAGTDLRYGFIWVAASHRHVYALFSGRNHDEAPGRAAFGTLVEVFDWNARAVRRIGLGEDALAIAVDSDDRNLYALVHEPFPAVVRYRLVQTPVRPKGR